MQRNILVLGTAIALLLLGSVALIYRVTTPPPELGAAPRPPGAPAAPPEQVAASPVAVVPPAVAPAAPRTAPAPILPPESVPSPVPTPPPAWMAGSTASLGKTLDSPQLASLAPFVASGLGRLERSVSECVHEAPAGATAGSGGRKTTLTLHIETLDAKLRVVDATPPTAESSTDWRVQCAQRKLRGQTFPAPARKGQTFEVPFVLNL